MKKNNITVISHSSYVGKIVMRKVSLGFLIFKNTFYQEILIKNQFFEKIKSFLATHHSEKILVSSKSTLKTEKFPIHLLKKQKFYFIQINFFLILKYYLKKN